MADGCRILEINHNIPIILGADLQRLLSVLKDMECECYLNEKNLTPRAVPPLWPTVQLYNVPMFNMTLLPS